MPNRTRASHRVLRGAAVILLVLTGLLVRHQAVDRCIDAGSVLVRNTCIDRDVVHQVRQELSQRG